MFSTDAPMTKSERTRAQLREIALRSFRERGYDDTTIRLIAQEAGVSVGTTHYHFASKNHLVQELYLDVQEGHRAAAEPGLAASTDLVDRVGIVYRTGLDQLEPYHGFAPGFLSAAVSPRSPINPLSDDSAPALAIVEGLFREAVDGADDRLPADLRDALPQALVIGHLLLAMFWVYDSSPGQRRTRLLLDRGLRLLRLGLPLARLPIMRAPLRELLGLIADVRIGSTAG
ncbi:TetR/AcrR family transcriptional regulator [Microbacterium sp. ASV49]|uniref:TetR family transcriptional regulator n=1 Tax=Microbacterium candidum TaxID=3041922 RepID=A0ABT7MZ38_9MICO|nr:TetR/AcrR family transcriptional regulator [Microbacterium sp. ASV49]MDL9979718.1 TetR family transcriptional regulator [Microbacterium sp. ASV49]